MQINTLADLLPNAVDLTGPTSGLIDLGGSLQSWQEVDRASRRLASALVESGIETGDRVAVLQPKSAASFISVHAVLRAGGVLVPLDPIGAPAAHASILEQTEPRAVIGHGPTLSRLVLDALVDSPTVVVAAGDGGVLVDGGVPSSRLVDYAESVAGSETAEILPALDPSDLAYVIFTSGSTGTPKGIVHTHASALAYARQAVAYHDLRVGDRLAGTAPLHVDMSTLELYAVPLAGATAVTIGEPEQRFAATLSERLETERITHLYAVPFQLRQLQQRGVLERRDLSALRHVAYGGEPFAPGALAELMHALPHAEVLNVYGPAEVNAVSSHVITDPPTGDEPVPIGRAWPGVDFRIVDEAGSAVDGGATGELVISSPTCMQGYWNRPELSAERLEPRVVGPPWYSTGDLVTMHDGVLHFRGRRDHQVKVRGVRLELEAIESVLTDAPEIEHAVVGRAETVDGDGELVAWVVLVPNAYLDLRTLRMWCSRQLPSIAVPTTVTAIDSVPTTSSGKIDRRALRQQLTGPSVEHG